VDYVGDVAKFDEEFNADVAVAMVAAKAFGLPADLKLSVHSGSDKFSIYPSIRKACARFGAGVHVKTAGTTWVEEAAALAAAGGDGLKFTCDAYAYAYEHYDELVAPYAAVIDIARDKLPKPEEVAKWSAEKLAAALRHEQGNPNYDLNIRQLVHVSYKMAANEQDRYFALLDKYAGIVSEAVTDNIYRRHMLRLFVGE
jgi:hypothetical protein